MVDRSLDQGKFNIGKLVDSLLVGIQLALIGLTIWTIISLSVHTYLLKVNLDNMKAVVGRTMKPIWLTDDVDKLREDIALEYLLMTKTSSEIIIVVPDDR